MIPRGILGFLAVIVAVVVGGGLFLLTGANFKRPYVRLSFLAGLLSGGAVFFVTERLHLVKKDTGTASERLSLKTTPETPITDGVRKDHQSIRLQ